MSTGRGSAGAFAEGRYPAIMLHTPYDKATKRYTEIADYFVPRGYAVVLVDMRDRYRSEGIGHVLPLGDAAHRQRRLRHRRVDRRAAVEQRPRRHRRQLVRGPGADPHGARAAAAPDGDLARRGDDEQLRQLQPREGGAMQGHMFWALFIHAQDAQEVRDDPALSRAGLGRPAEPPRAATGRRRGGAARRRFGSCRRSSRR